MYKANFTIGIIAFIVSVSSLFAINNMPVIAQFNGEHHRSGYGTSMTTLDFNHDGYDDLIIVSGSYGYITGQSPSRGKVYIYYGGPGFSSTSAPNITMEGDYYGTGGRILFKVLNMGDLNNDGFEDLCLIDSHPFGVEDARFRIYYGGTADLLNPNHIFLYPSEIILQVFNKLGDYNGDHYDDIGIACFQQGMQHFNILWGNTFNETPILVTAEASYSYLASIIGIGDVNNDGYDDFSLGYTNPDPVIGYHLIKLYYGNAAGDVSDPDTLIQTQSAITKISKPLGDMNADGYDDFMGYVSDAGMHAWLGCSTINYASPDFYLYPLWLGGEFSQSLEYGDFNNDGFDDVVGADFYDRKFSVWLGKQNVNGTSDYIVSRLMYDHFGYGLTSGDFNADGFCDFAISAPFEDSPLPEGDFYGFVWVYGGNAQLADTTVANEDPNIPEPMLVLNLRIYPNPANTDKGDINITFNQSVLRNAEPIRVQIFNIRGQLVYEDTVLTARSESNHNINISKLPSGIYICKATRGRLSSNKRFTIINGSTR